MTRASLDSHVDADGVLRLEIPFGASEAGRDVRVTVEPSHRQLTHNEWIAFLAVTSGAWKGEFERPLQGDYEVRDSL
jgi:hypothetical protein